MSQTFPATISRDDWFPCEPNADGSYCLQKGGQYLAAMRFFDGPGEHFEYVVVTVSYPNGYLALETEDAEIEPTEVAFLALLEGGHRADRGGVLGAAVGWAVSTIRRIIRIMCGKVVAWLDRTEPVQCTWVSAAWCPVCGDCTCPDREQSMNHWDCPLHGEHSRHAEGGK